MAQPLDSLDRTAAIRAIATSPVDYVRLMACSPLVTAALGDDLAWYLTDLPFPPFNAVGWTDLRAEDADARIAAMVAAARSRAVPLIWWVTPLARPDDLSERLQAHGFRLFAHMPGMACSLSELPALGCPPGLTISRVENEAGLRTYVEVLAAGSAFPAWTVDSYVELFAAAGFDSIASHFVARLGDDPVAIATVIYGSSVAGIYNVVTVERARRRGIGAAVTGVAMREAHARGCPLAVLHASEMGLPVYRRLGFHECTPVDMYLWRPQASAL